MSAHDRGSSELDSCISLLRIAGVALDPVGGQIILHVVVLRNQSKIKRQRKAVTAPFTMILCLLPIIDSPADNVSRSKWLTISARFLVGEKGVWFKEVRSTGCAFRAPRVRAETQLFFQPQLASPASDL